MKFQITAWEDLAFVDEEVDNETDQFRHTSFAVFDANDIAYFGKLNQHKSTISFPQLSFALAPIPDHELFPEWGPCSGELTKAQDTLSPNVYVKRPNLAFYEIFQDNNVLELLPKNLLEEARTMEIISQNPHPNIIRYHGCRVRRGRITGLVLDRHPYTLEDYLKNDVGLIDKEKFIHAITSAVCHLHSLGWAHNDLNPSNILIDDEGMPALIDFGSARKIGTKLGSSRGTEGWIDGLIEDYHTSDQNHDLSAIEKIRKWLDAPTFDD